MGRGHCVTCDLFHGSGHFVNRSRRLFDFIVLLLHATRRFFGDRAQLFGGRRELCGRTGNLFDRLAQVLLHAHQCFEQARRFVFAVDFNVFSQIATRNIFCGADGSRQRVDNAACQQQGE